MLTTDNRYDHVGRASGRFFFSVKCPKHLQSGDQAMEKLRSKLVQEGILKDEE